MDKSDVGIIGLGLMGRNLSLNFSRRGFSVVVHDPVQSGEQDLLADFLKNNSCNGFKGARTLDDFAGMLQKPRKIMLMIKAGKPVDDVINRLMPYLDSGDIVIDAGNSHYHDSSRRLDRLEKQGILFVGCGVSGGGEGALHGPSLMPGGSSGAWPALRPLLQSIAARLDDGSPCCEWIGPGGSGHLVKMIHNGIEYAMMQAMAEAFDVMKKMCGLAEDDISRVFEEWKAGEPGGYLVEIIPLILQKRDKDGFLLDSIRDKAWQKGTGRDAAASALEWGVPVPCIDEAVSARFISSLLEERRRAAQAFAGTLRLSGDRDVLIHDLRDALYCAIAISLAQGFALLAKGGENMGWKLDRAAIAHIWRGGSIIQSKIMGEVETIFKNDPSAPNMLLEQPLVDTINRRLSGWRRVVSAAVLHGVPVNVISSALSYFDSYRSERLPANLIQAMRDCFGAHGYERMDAPPGTLFHTDWKKQS